jgi:hypothetical protein
MIDSGLEKVLGFVYTDRIEELDTAAQILINQMVAGPQEDEPEEDEEEN